MPLACQNECSDLLVLNGFRSKGTPTCLMDLLMMNRFSDDIFIIYHCVGILMLGLFVIISACIGILVCIVFLIDSKKGMS
jgi:hypothetical protein